MKNTVLAMAVVLSLSSAYAQETEVVNQPVVETSTSPIYIMNNQKTVQGASQTQTAVQEQPMTVIQASPLKESRAEQMRKARQSVEADTEQKIVEKLEQARMEDERDRAERLFGNRFGNQKQSTESAATAINSGSGSATSSVVNQPVQVVTPSPVTVNAVEARSEAKIEDDVETTTAANRVYVSALAGWSDYPSASNVRGNGTMGVTAGVVTPSNLIFEGTFAYSDFDIEVVGQTLPWELPPFKSLAQYNFEGAVKYQFLPDSMIKPNIGVVAAYVYRKYADKQYYYVPSSDVSTNAVDLGLTTGVDVELTKTFSIGADFRYMTNMMYRENTTYQQSFLNQRAGNPLEDIDYYRVGVVGRVTF